MLKKTLIALALILAVLAGIIAMQPSEFTVSRSITVNAPASAVFEQVNDFHQWESWSPWVKIDPNATSSFSGPESGTGATMGWKGNSEVGEGSMTITESIPNERVAMRLDFVEPMAGTATSAFDLKEENGTTTVTWSMSGHNNFIAKAVSLVMNCEEMIGTYYDEGLANIKAITEQPKP
jgi:uncharacterized protein YndB with AHSA1/START domain